MIRIVFFREDSQWHFTRAGRLRGVENYNPETRLYYKSYDLPIDRL